MLNNRIIVIGLGRGYLEMISKMKSDFIFIHLDHPSKYKSSVHGFECLIFENSFLLEMGDIIKDFKGRPIFGIGTGPALDGIQWVESHMKLEGWEALLFEHLGTVREPPVATGKIEAGLVVKNKTFSGWGLGVVIEEVEEDLYLVRFPKALKLTKKENHLCHKSILRIICTMKELKNETHQ